MSIPSLFALSALLAALGLSALAATAPLAQTVASGSGDKTPTVASAPLSQGEANIASALAKESLAQAGITQPTPAQMQTALDGGIVTRSDGTSVTLTGVMVQRQSGLGWGQIAHSMGVKLGSLVSASKTTHAGKKPSAASDDTALAQKADKANGAGTHGKSAGGSHAGTGGNGGNSGNGGSGGAGGGGKK